MSFAAQSATKPVITITPAHATDWKYKVGGKATFKVAVTNADTVMENVEIKYTIGYEKQPPLDKD